MVCSESQEYKTFYDTLLYEATSSSASRDDPGILQQSEQTQDKEDQLPYR